MFAMDEDRPFDEDSYSEENINEYDDEAESDEGERQVDQIISEGFSAPNQNEDPFRVQSRPGSVENKPVFTLFPEPNNGNDDKDKYDPKSDEIQKKKKQKQGKPFKILKPPRARSTVSELSLDPEEEKLKLLPDCCEFTGRKNELEIDEGRKEMLSDWFSQIKLTHAQQKQLCFSESLLMVEETGTVVGKYYTTITNSKWNDRPCLCVHSGSFGKFSTGLESGTSITSFINYSLRPLQEFVHEWATINSDTIERKTFLMKEMDALSSKIQLIRNGQLVDTKIHAFGLKEKENLAELGSGWENVKGKQMKTWGIRRTVHVSDNEERTWDSLYNKNARLVLRCQPDSPQALIPLWFESIIDFDKHGNFIGTYSPYAWACDVELFSKYAVKKDELTHDHRRYILDHPEIRALLSDYIQSILFRKPQNVMEFTKQYFESLLNLRAKPTKSQGRKTVQTSSKSSSFYSDSSISLISEDTLIGEGQLLGEGDDRNASSFYPVNPKVTYDGLEKVDDGNVNTESEMFTTENETEDDLVVDEHGQYIRFTTTN